MASEAQLEKWGRIETYIRDAVNVSSLSEADVESVLHYLDCNELGLAFETFLFAYLEEGLVIGDAAGRHLDKAAELMNYETGLWKQPIEYLEKVRKF